jgi:hypothetical protein
VDIGDETSLVSVRRQHVAVGAGKADKNAVAVGIDA